MVLAWFQVFQFPNAYRHAPCFDPTPCPRPCHSVIDAPNHHRRSLASWPAPSASNFLDAPWIERRTMDSVPADYLEASNVVLFALYAGVLLTVILSWRARAEPDLDHVPLMAHTAFLPRFFNIPGYLFGGFTTIQKGYQKHFPGVFRIPAFRRSLVIITNPELVEDIRKASEDQLSLAGAARNLDATLDYLGQQHVFLVRESVEMTAHVSRSFPLALQGVHEDLRAAFKVVLPIVSELQPVWKEANGTDVVSRLVVAANLRALVGHTGVRDGDVVRRSLRLVKESFQASVIGRLVPYPLRLLRLAINRRKMKAKLVSAVKRTRATVVAQTDWNQQPTDVLSYLIRSQTTESSDEKLAEDMYRLLVAANHTISLALTHALYHLAANPRYACMMRKEIEAVVFREGWSKSGLDKMKRLDSFLKESLRLSAVEPLTMMRKAENDFVFSNGVSLPKNALVFAAAHARHLDQKIYADADTFDGFRFSKESCEEGGSRCPPVVNTTADYLAWGYGRHACPGRFYASAVMKMVLAHIVVGYDVRFEDGVRPKDVFLGLNRIPDRKATVLFRKR